ncbi:MAG: YggT family protein [Chloroflexi bacterium]|nr:YggT family protein [Chloroflexota bacterium]MBI3740260.1 YggT family protein [Chloroflexota bacterium]
MGFFLVNFFDLLFNALILAIIARAILSWLPIDPLNPIVNIINQITEPILAPLRRFIPPVGGMMDITPIIAIIILQVLQTIVLRVLSAYY